MQHKLTHSTKPKKAFRDIKIKATGNSRSEIKKFPPPPYEIPENSRFHGVFEGAPKGPKHCRNAAF